MTLYLSISTSLSQSIVLPKLQEMIPAAVLGPAPGINDRILNYKLWESSFIVQNFLVSTFISCLPYFHIPQICFLPENISKVLHVLVNILFPLTEGTVFSSPGHVTFFITSHWSIMLKLWLFSLPVISDSLCLHGLQHSRHPCPSLCSGVCANSCPLSWWCYLTDDIILFRDVSRNC